MRWSNSINRSLIAESSAQSGPQLFHDRRFVAHGRHHSHAVGESSLAPQLSLDVIPHIADLTLESLRNIRNSVAKNFEVGLSVSDTLRDRQNIGGDARGCLRTEGIVNGRPIGARPLWPGALIVASGPSPRPRSGPLESGRGGRKDAGSEIEGPWPSGPKEGPGALWIPAKGQRTRKGIGREGRRGRSKSSRRRKAGNAGKARASAAGKLAYIVPGVAEAAHGKSGTLIVLSTRSKQRSRSRASERSMRGAAGCVGTFSGLHVIPCGWRH